MLAALIASQSLVAFVAAAPTPAVKSLDTLYKDYPDKVERIKCFIAKDPKYVAQKTIVRLILPPTFWPSMAFAKPLIPRRKLTFKCTALMLEISRWWLIATFKHENVADFPKYKALDSVNARTIDSVNALWVNFQLQKCHRF